MTGRRQHPRYPLAAPLEGQLRVREEVVIERWDANEIEVIATAACRISEQLTLETAANSGRLVLLTVLENRPFMNAEGLVRHRVRFSIGYGGLPAAPQERHGR